MKHSSSYRSSPLRISLMVCILGMSVLLSSCARTGKTVKRNRPQTVETRSELVFLNIPEASGWVAYNCNPGGSPEMEDYRVVVIRQKSGEIIYDSQIPLAADLCTHGFEMAQDDPRLQRLAQNVDADIIDPLEAYQKSLETETPAPELKKPAPKAAQPEATESVDDKAETNASAVGEEVPNVKAEVVKVKILGMAAEMVLLGTPNGLALQPGDRLFLREEPDVIAFPGSDETFVASEGQVTGFVQVVTVENNTAKAKILSGTIPGSGYAEKSERP